MTATLEPTLFDVAANYPRADAWWRRQADEALRVAIASGNEFTTDDLRDLGVPDLDRKAEQAAVWGSLLAAAKASGRIREVGRRPSLRKSANYRKVTVWSGIAA